MHQVFTRTIDGSSFEAVQGRSILKALLVDLPFNSLASLEKVASQARFRTAEFDMNSVGEIVDWKVKDW